MTKISISTLAGIFITFIIYYTALIFIHLENTLLIHLFFAMTFTVLIALYKNKITSPPNLFLLTSVLFLSIRPVLSLIQPNQFNYKVADWFIYGEQSNNNLITANMILISMFCGYAISFFVFKQIKNTSQNYSIVISGRLKSILIIIYTIGSISIVITGLHNWFIVQTEGYLSIYNNYTPPPFNIDKLTYLFYVGFFLLCALAPNLRTNKIFLLSSIAICLFSTLKGSRGEFITFFLTIASIYFSEKKTNNLLLIIKMIVIFSLLFIVSEFISMWRSNGNFSELMLGKGNPALNFIYGIGVSYLTLVQSADIVSNNIIGDVQPYYFLFSQPILVIDKIFNLNIDPTLISYSHFISNYSNAIQYSEGAGLGGSYIAEAYSLGGYTACFLLAFLLMSMTYYGYLKSKSDWRVYYIFYTSLPSILFIPRETYFYYIPFVIKGIVVVLIFSLLIKKDCHE
ncbi:O-antigen polysaccharide polymerase Wzy [Morganella morganii]